MNPPYTITPKILKLVGSVSEKLGEVNANYLTRQSPQIHKENRIKTIHSSLSIEGNTLNEEQVTALLENKKVVGPKKDIQEVVNAIKVYDNLHRYNYASDKSFLKAHQHLMQGTLEGAGHYRKQGVGIAKGKNIKHIAPPYKNVPYLMKDLFSYLKNSDEMPLIKSCVFHYEMEFIHPFLDGNGRMGRLWQTLILLETYPIFEYLPFETFINQHPKVYYKALSQSDSAGSSTPFIEYMLNLIDHTLADLLAYNNRTLKDTDRLEYFLGTGVQTFTRKDYMNVFKDLSSATASRDLKKGLELNLFTSSGNRNQTNYNINKKA